jgi:hypothetical protein
LKVRVIKQRDVNRFIVEHPTFSGGIKIPDNDWIEYLRPTLAQMQGVKSKFYNYFRVGLDQLIDEMDKGFEYNQALRIIKAHGFGLPIRIKNWGYQEPLTIDELLNKLDKNSKHWEQIFENAVERQQIVEKKKQVTQKTLIE